MQNSSQAFVEQRRLSFCLRLAVRIRPRLAFRQWSQLGEKLHWLQCSSLIVRRASNLNVERHTVPLLANLAIHCSFQSLPIFAVSSHASNPKPNIIICLCRSIPPVAACRVSSRDLSLTTITSSFAILSSAVQSASSDFGAVGQIDLKNISTEFIHIQFSFFPISNPIVKFPRGKVCIEPSWPVTCRKSDIGSGSAASLMMVRH